MGCSCPEAITARVGPKNWSDNALGGIDPSRSQPIKMRVRRVLGGERRCCTELTGSASAHTQDPITDEREFRGLLRAIDTSNGRPTLGVALKVCSLEVRFERHFDPFPRAVFQEDGNIGSNARP